MKRCTAVMAILALIAALCPDLFVSRASASCITWQGGQTCDTPAPRGNFRYQAPSRSGGGVRTYSGGGGGYGRAAAALGAASAAIGILGMMIEAAEAQRQNEANEAQRQAYNACQAQYRKAYAINEKARALTAQGDADESFRLFETAMSTLGDCGARSDLAKLRNNLDIARKEYVALTRPSEAPRYGGGAPKNNLPTVADLQARAATQCTHLTQDTPPWQACMREAEARLAMYADEGIQNACQSIADVETRNQCVFNRYGAMIAGQNADQFGDPSNCYFDERGKPCHPGGATAAAKPLDANSDPNSLRNRLRRALAEKSAELEKAKALRDSLPPESPDRKALDEAIAKEEASVASNPPPATDDAYDNYMNSGNASSGARNNGAFDPSGFSMNGSDTQREIDRLMGR